MEHSNGEGTFGGKAAFDLLIQSGLAKDVLREIWEVAQAHNKSPVLTQQEFYAALRLIAVAQHSPNTPLNDDTLRQTAGLDVALPMPWGREVRVDATTASSSSEVEAEKVDGVEKIPKLKKGIRVIHTRTGDGYERAGVVVGVHTDDAVNGVYYTVKLDEGHEIQTVGRKLRKEGEKSEQSGATSIPLGPGQEGVEEHKSTASSEQSSSQSSGQAASVENEKDWSIDEEKMEKYERLFDNVATDGFVSGESAIAFFQKSGLPHTQLAHLWNIADVNGAGRLNKSSFCVAFHIAVMVSKYQWPMPLSLPDEMLQYMDSTLNQPKSSQEEPALVCEEEKGGKAAEEEEDEDWGDFEGATEDMSLERTTAQPQEEAPSGNLATDADFVDLRPTDPYDPVSAAELNAETIPQVSMDAEAADKLTVSATEETLDKTVEHASIEPLSFNSQSQAPNVDDAIAASNEEVVVTQQEEPTEPKCGYQSGRSGETEGKDESQTAATREDKLSKDDIELLKQLIAAEQLNECLQVLEHSSNGPSSSESEEPTVAELHREVETKANTHASNAFAELSRKPEFEEAKRSLLQFFTSSSDTAQKAEVQAKVVDLVNKKSLAKAVARRCLDVADKDGCFHSLLPSWRKMLEAITKESDRCVKVAETLETLKQVGVEDHSKVVSPSDLAAYVENVARMHRVGEMIEQSLCMSLLHNSSHHEIDAAYEAWCKSKEHFLQRIHCRDFYDLSQSVQLRNEPFSSSTDLYVEEDEAERPDRCGLTLQSITGDVHSVVEYSGRMYHLSALNLWLNSVEPTLPS